MPRHGATSCHVTNPRSGQCSTPEALLAFFDSVVAEGGDSSRQLHVFVEAAAGPASTDVCGELLLGGGGGGGGASDGGGGGGGATHPALDGMVSVGEWKRQQKMHETLV